ncbi:MAG: type II secretion system F family protein [Pseudohongiella sp.]|nr:type II secretion system F family protein [Pseudohongiella sp.]
MTTTLTTRFVWTGKNFKGQKVAGESEATNTENLRRLLYQQGILVSSAKKIRPAAMRQKIQNFSTTETAVFLRQCASLLKAGLPLVQTLDICLESVVNTAFRGELQRVRDQLTEGSSFYAALRGGSLGRDSLLLSLVQAAEQSGTLETMMEKLAQDYEKTEQLRARVQSALMYPIAVLLVAVSVTIVLLVKVVPQFAQTFSGLGAELPAITQALLRLSDLAIQYALITGVAGIAAAFTVSVCLRRYKKVRLWKDRLLCHLPVTGDIVKHACVARFCQILGSSLKAGVPLLQALQSSASATGNLVYEQACQDLAELINQGQTLSFGVRKARCFPVMIGQLIYVGEQSGTLDQMLENCATRYEQSVDNAVGRLSSLIEPVIMTVLGAIIATLLLAMYLPVFRLGAVL